jgi:transposase-like protein
MGYSVAEIARNLGFNENILGRWKQEMTHETESKLGSKNDELIHLRKENKQSQIERNS